MKTIDIYKTKNRNTIKKIILSDDISEFLLNEFDENILETFNLNKGMLNNPKLIIYVMRIDGELVGIAFFKEEENGCVRVDEGFIKKIRGKVAKELASLTLSSYISEYKPYVLIGEIVKENRRALVFAKWLGFKIKSEDETKFYVEKKEIKWAA